MKEVNAAAAAKLLQSCLTLCDPIDGGPPDSPIPGILQARTLEWVAISFSNAWKGNVKVKSLSRVQLLVTPWSAAHQAPPSMGFSRQEYWSGVPFPSPFSRQAKTVLRKKNEAGRINLPNIAFSKIRFSRLQSSEQIQHKAISLVVQWLRLQASTAEATSLIPGWGTKIPICHVSWPKKRNPTRYLS